MDNVPGTYEHLLEAETLATEVLSLKEQIFDLHKRLNECREALAYVTKSDVDKAFVFEGCLLVKNSREQVLHRLRTDLREFNEEIQRRGADMRTHVFRLQDLELRAPFPGRSLVPLGRDELKALGQVWGEQA